MEQIKKAVKELLEERKYTPIMVRCLNLILDDKMNSIALKQCLSGSGYTLSMIKPEALQVILDYSEIILEDDVLTENEIRIITLLKMFFQIKDGDFYTYGKKEIVDSVLMAQLEKMYADNIINKEEALKKTDLQGLFCLSYDQFSEIVNKVAKSALERGANIKDLDTFIFFGILFFSSFNWRWIMGGSRSFHHGSVHYHKNNTIDISWTKIIFYPIVVSGSFIGLYCIYLSTKEDE